MTRLTLRPIIDASKIPKYAVHDDRAAALGTIERQRPNHWRFTTTAGVAITSPSLRQLRIEIRDFYATR